ncbi:MAG: U32 family peptidase C-terminal domain-containing protein [Candidatus Norongarragalinales archaeon]
MEEPEKKLVGKVTHWFGKISVAVVELQGELCVGDEVSIEGPNTGEVRFRVDSMQIEHKNVERAGKGESIGLKVPERIHEHDYVYKLA